MRRLGERRERGVAHRGIGGRDHGEMIVARATPRRCRRRARRHPSDRTSARQQIDRVVSIRLIEPHHVGAGGKRAFLQRRVAVARDAPRCPARAARDQLRDARRDRPDRSGSGSRTAPPRAPAPGVQALQIEIAAAASSTAARRVERRERRRLVVVDVIARRPAEGSARAAATAGTTPGWSRPGRALARSVSAVPLPKVS